MKVFSRLFRRGNVPMQKPSGRLYISGTGRAGTTFLMELLGAVGMDTGFGSDLDEMHGLVHYYASARAGLEWDLFDPKGPDVVKSPYLCDQVDALVADGFEIRHVVIPVRKLKDAAESRRAVQRSAGDDVGSAGVAGGLWDAKVADEQEAVLACKLYALVEALVRHDIPMTFLHFPTFATDAEYCHAKLKPLLPRIEDERFFAAFSSVSRPNLINQFNQAF